MEDNRNRFVPPHVTAKDISKIEGCTLSAARGILKRLRKKLGLTGMQKLSILNYSNGRGISLSETINRLLKLILIITSIGILYTCGKIIYSKLYDMYKENKSIKWNVITPNHLEGEIYDSTGVKKMDIQVDYITPLKKVKPN